MRASDSAGNRPHPLRDGRDASVCWACGRTVRSWRSGSPRSAGVTSKATRGAITVAHPGGGRAGLSPWTTAPPPPRPNSGPVAPPGVVSQSIGVLRRRPRCSRGRQASAGRSPNGRSSVVVLSKGAFDKPASTGPGCPVDPFARAKTFSLSGAARSSLSRASLTLPQRERAAACTGIGSVASVELSEDSGNPRSRNDQVRSG
jgi:hypothetical protein